jgi:PAS domain S-box-containing protein
MTLAPASIELLPARHITSRELRLGIAAAGSLLVATGMVVAFGWFAEIPSLIRLQPSWPSMKFNTAVCFALLGAGSLALISRHPAPARLCALLVAGIGLATEFEYASGLSLGIDQVLMPAFQLEPGVPPGRMSPITAALFILAGIGMAALCGRVSSARATLTGVFASIIAGVALAALIGHATRTPTAYSWGALVSVAVHTAGSFVLVAAALGALAAIHEKELPPWLPWSALLAGMACTVAMGSALFYELRATSLVPEIVLAVGTTMSALMASSLHARRRLKGQRDLLAASLKRTADSEQLIHGVLEAAPEAVIVNDVDGHITLVNSMAERMFGYSRDALVGMQIERLVPEQLREKHAEHRQSFTSAPAARSMGEGRELLGLRKDGSVFPVEVSLNSFQSAGRKLVVSAVRDITSRRAAEQRLRDSLQEKELLLKEIHHRVKNNLQVVASMLTLQVMRADDTRATAMLEACRQRVMSMAKVHEKLYGERDVSRVDLAELIRDIGTMVVAGVPGITIEFRHDGGPIVVDVETAFPAGLIANELITNSIKHAFVGRTHGRILVDVKRVDRESVCLQVADDGVGGVTPAALERSSGLGSTIVRTLVRQLDGTLSVGPGPGASVAILFPLRRRSE